jgi:hypothetical protein
VEVRRAAFAPQARARCQLSGGLEKGASQLIQHAFPDDFKADLQLNRLFAAFKNATCQTRFTTDHLCYVETSVCVNYYVASRINRYIKSTFSFRD